MAARRQANRNELIGEAYAAHAERLHRFVAARSEPAHRHLTDDACAFAWQRLVDRRDVAIDPELRFVGWLHTVAQREHWQLIRGAVRDLSLDSWQGAGPDGEGSAPVKLLAGTDDPPTLAEQREQMRLLNDLPPARREALVLKAIGHSYAEIGALMGLSHRQVDRYLTEGSKRVRELHRERSEHSSGPQEPARHGGRETQRPDLELSPTRNLELNLDL